MLVQSVSQERKWLTRLQWDQNLGGTAEQTDTSIDDAIQRFINNREPRSMDTSKREKQNHNTNLAIVFSAREHLWSNVCWSPNRGLRLRMQQGRL
jgi:predicted component of type VI protein secretion system